MNKYLQIIRNLDKEIQIKWWLLNHYKSMIERLQLIKQTTPLTINKTLPLKILISKVYGKTVQDGEPTPESPVAIDNVTGKNLLNYKTVEATSNTTVQLIDNGFKVTGKYAGKIIITGLKKNTDYYLQYIRENIIERTQQVSIFAGTTQTSKIKDITSSGTFNTGENTSINIWFYASIGGDDGESNFTNIMLEEGSVASPYVPYNTIEFKVENKNLLDVSKSETGGIDASGNLVNGTSLWRANTFIDVKPNTQYTLSRNEKIISSENIIIRLYQYDKDKNFITPRSESTTKTLTITTTNNTHYLKWTVYKVEGLSLEIINLMDLQIEERKYSNKLYSPRRTNLFIHF